MLFRRHASVPSHDLPRYQQGTAGRLSASVPLKTFCQGLQYGGMSKGITPSQKQSTAALPALPDIAPAGSLSADNIPHLRNTVP